MIFATFITLILVPISHLILDDIRRALRRMFGSADPAEGLEANSTRAAATT